MPLSPSRTRRFAWSMAILVVLINFPLLNSTWTSWRVDSDGVDTTAEVLEIRRVAGTEDYWVSFRFDPEVDPDGTVWPAKVDRAAYDVAERTGRIGVRVLPDRPAAHRVDGREAGRAGLFTTLVLDGLLLLVAVWWWRTRRRRSSGETEL